MHWILLLTSILWMTLASACKPSQSGETTNNTPSKGPKHKVTGQVMHTRAYCGGAAPSEEMLERYRTPVPLPGLSLYLRSGRLNVLNRPILDSTTTDAEGRFTFNLPAGEYCIITKSRIKPPRAADYKDGMYELAEDCVDEWIANCDITFAVVDQAVVGLGMQLHKECFKEDFNPCIRYIGPLPP